MNVRAATVISTPLYATILPSASSTLCSSVLKSAAGIPAEDNKHLGPVEAAQDGGKQGLDADPDCDSTTPIANAIHTEFAITRGSVF